MRNEISNTDTSARNIPIHVPVSNELKHFLHRFWNMVEMPHTSESADLSPKIEVVENKDAITVSAELPGIDAKDIDLQISSDGYLTISGEKKCTKEHNEKDNSLRLRRKNGTRGDRAYRRIRKMQDSCGSGY